MEFLSSLYDWLHWLARWGLMVGVLGLLVNIFCILIIKIDAWRGGRSVACDLHCDWSLLGIAFTLCSLALVVVINL